PLPSPSCGCVSFLSFDESGSSKNDGRSHVPARRHSSVGGRIIREMAASASSRASSLRPRALRWVAPAVLPVVNLALALLLSAAVVLAGGEDAGRALWLLGSGGVGGGGGG